MSTAVSTNKRKRGAMSRRYIFKVLQNPQHPMYTAKDVDFARLLHVTRLTVINIRKEKELKGRKSRIVDLLQKIDTTKFTLNELSINLRVNYQNLYKLVKSMDLQTRPDKKPVEYMIEYQKTRATTSLA